MKLPEMLADRLGVSGSRGNKGGNRNGGNVDALLLEVLEQTMRQCAKARPAKARVFVDEIAKSIKAGWAR